MGFAQAGGQFAVKDTGHPSRVSFAAEVGSGSSTYLITAAANTAGVLVWTCSLSGFAGAQATAGFNSTDQIMDDSGVLNFNSQIGLPALATGQSFACTSQLEQDMQGILVPAGNGIKLVNGGAGGTGALRTVSGTIVVTMLV